MSLRRDLDPNQYRRRRIDEIRELLDDDDRAVLDEWLRDTRISPDRISKELAAEGHSVSIGAVAGYRFQILDVGSRAR